jgi:two-component system, LytTR family, sensor kinase
LNCNSFIFSEKKDYKFFRHFSFWLIFLLHDASSYIPANNTNDLGHPYVYLRAMLISLCYFPSYIFSVYFFLRMILPAIFKNKFSPITWLLPLMIAINMLLASISTDFLALIFPREFTFNLNSVNFIPNTIHRGIGYCFVVTTLAVAIKLIKEWAKQRKKINQMEKEKSKAEFALLKAQLYPEIILNCFNRLGGKIKSNAEEAAEAILKLSDILSFILYETNGIGITLEMELAAIKNLIEFNELQNTIAVSTKLSIEKPHLNHTITPMIVFMVFQYLYFEAEKSVLHPKPVLSLSISTTAEMLVCSWEATQFANLMSAVAIQRKITGFLTAKTKSMTSGTFIFNINSISNGLKIDLRLNRLNVST